MNVVGARSIGRWKASYIVRAASRQLARPSWDQVSRAMTVAFGALFQKSWSSELKYVPPARRSSRNPPVWSQALA